MFNNISRSFSSKKLFCSKKYLSVLPAIPFMFVASVSNAELVWNDTFENSVQGVDAGDFPLTVRSSSTPSGSTGPSSAASGSSYAYLETSSGGANAWRDYALFEGPTFTQNDATISFNYHMYGANIGTLTVEAKKAGQWVPVWSRSGQQQSSSAASWRSASIDVDDTTQIRFYAHANGSYRGDIAIDNIKVDVDGGPPPVLPYIVASYSGGVSGAQNGVAFSPCSLGPITPASGGTQRILTCAGTQHAAVVFPTGPGAPCAVVAYFEFPAPIRPYFSSGSSCSWTVYGDTDDYND